MFRRGADKPYSLDREIFVRVGRQTLKADAEQSSAIVRKTVSQFDRWEFEPLPGFEVADCDTSELADTRSGIVDVGHLGEAVPQDSLDFLRRLHLARCRACLRRDDVRLPRSQALAGRIHRR